MASRSSRPSAFTLLHMYEYKVLTFDRTRGLGASDRIKPDVLEAMLNDHADEGWRLVSCTCGLGSKGASELVLILERTKR